MMELATMRVPATPPPPSEVSPLPYGRASPRSPLECDLLGPSDSSGKKTVEALVCRAPPVHIKDVVVVSRVPPKISRKVSFSSNIEWHEVRHLKDYSPEEVELLWMTMKDYQSTKAAVKSTVLMMMTGDNVLDVDPNFCSRGLEFRTKAGARFRNRNKIAARAAVLNEQEMQMDEGFFDPQYIKMVSEEASQACRDGAYERALYDEKYIQDYIQDVRNIWPCT